MEIIVQLATGVAFAYKIASGLLTISFIFGIVSFITQMARR